MNQRRIATTVALILLAPVGLPFLPTAAASGPAFGTGTPTFTMYPGPQALVGTNDGEPSIGVNWNSGAVMFTGDFFVNLFTETRVDFDDSFSPPKATWTDVTPLAGIPGNIDPILYTDPVTGRTWAGGLDGACSVLYITDDDGANWLPGGNSCVATLDHETIGSGPYHDPAPAAATYERAVYYCAQAAAVTCATSYDGGLTYPIISQVSCEFTTPQFHGSVSVAADGTAWLPFGQGTDHLCVAKSTDNGVSWQDIVLQPSTPAGGFDPDVATTPSSWVYVGYPDGNGRAHAALTKDGGATWTYSPDLGASYGLKTTTFHEMIAGDDQRAALAFLGTTVSGPSTAFSAAGFTGVWHLYIAYTYDGGQTWTTIRASDDPVQRGCIWDGGGDNACRNLLDFMDATVDEEGRVLVGFADGCMGACAGPTGTVSQSRSTWGTIARQTTGKGLFAAKDSASISVTSPITGTSGEPTSLSATVTLAPPYDLTVHWGDGAIQSFPGQTAALFTASHTYASAGQYDITVSGIGDDGATAVGTATASVAEGTTGGAIVITAPTDGEEVGDLVTVEGILETGGNLAPTAAFSSVVSGVSVQFDATASTDPDGDALAFTWAFGDGAIGVGVAPGHTYAASGTYTVCLTVSDGTLSDELCQPVTVFLDATVDTIADDPEGDEAAASLTGSNVPTVDILKLEATRTIGQEPVFITTVKDLTMDPPLTEASNGLFWMVEWTGPGAVIDYVQLTSVMDETGAFVQACTYGIITETQGQRFIEEGGPAPCTKTLGPNGKVSITYPETALGARGYTATTVLNGVIAEAGTVINIPQIASGSGNYDTTGPENYPLSMAPAKWQEFGLVPSRMAKSAPSSPPANPEVKDVVADPVGDNVPTTNVESAWFDSDADNLYVGLKVADIPADPTSTAFIYYAVNFNPTYTIADPSWGGEVGSTETFTGLRAFALFSPVRGSLGRIPPDPNNPPSASSDTATVFELHALSTSGAQSFFSPLGAVQGNIDANTDIVWWTIPRTKLQNPPGGAILEATSAASAPAVGGIVTFGGILSDTTGTGASYAFPTTQVTPPVVTLTGTPLAGSAPLDVAFTGTSSKATATWSLDFGDGSAAATGSGTLPAGLHHIYDSAGSYVARLSVLSTDGGAGAGQVSVNVGTVNAGTYVLVKAGILDAVEATCVSSCSSWSADLDLSTLDPGPVTVTATLYSNGDAVSVDSVNVELVRDTLVGIAIDAPADGATLDAGEISVSGRLARATDNKPTAILGADRSSGVAPLTVTFSLDGEDDNGIASWRFTTGDGRVVDGTTLPATVTHTYTTAGTYAATLDVVDTGGRHDSFSGAITVQAANTPPSVPSNPTPADGATNVAITVVLGWTATDADGNTLAYDVYLDTTDASTLYAADQTAAVIAGGLSAATTYKWRVVAKDGTDSTDGPVWTFTTGTPPASETTKPHVVVALIDTGTNPYHQEFRRTNLVENPSTYISNLQASQLVEVDLCFYDKITKAVSTGNCGKTFTQAYQADAAEWNKFDVSALSATGAGQGQVAWFPGTNVMAISFSHTPSVAPVGVDGGAGVEDSHGSWTSSNVGGKTTGTCPECIIVMIEGDDVDPINSAYRWAANQPWIDIITSSTTVGIFGLAGNPADFFDFNSQAAKTAVTSGKLMFESSGNGIANAGIAPTSTYLWGNSNPWTIAVGSASEHTGQMSGYSDWPNAITASGVSRMSANPASFTTTQGVGGTSFSSPSAAGVAARTLYAVRTAMNDLAEGPSTTGTKSLVRIGSGATAPTDGPLKNGALTRLELEEAVFKTARRGILPQVPNSFLPNDEIVDTPINFFKEGYGHVYRGDWGVNGPGAEATWSSAGDATAVILGQKNVPNRWIEEQWWERIVEPSQIFIFGAEVPDSDTDTFPTNGAANANGINGYDGTGNFAVKPKLPATRASVPIGTVPTTSAPRLYLHHNNLGPDPNSQVNDLIEYYMNSIADPSGGDPACTGETCPDESGLGGTGISTAGGENVYALDHPTLGGPVLLDTTKDIVVHVQASGFAGAPPTPLDVTVTLEAGAGLIGTATATRGADGVTYEARFKPLVGVLSDPAALHVAWEGPVYSFHVASQGASWMELPIAATLPPVDYESISYYVDDFDADYSANGDTVTLTRDITRLAGDADAGFTFGAPQAQGAIINVVSEDALVTGDAILGPVGSVHLYPCTFPLSDAGAAQVTMSVALRVGSTPIGSGSLTTTLVGPHDGWNVGVSVPLAMRTIKLPKDTPLEGTITISGPAGVFAHNMGVCGGGEAAPISVNLAIANLDATPTAVIGTLPSPLTGTVTLAGTATFPTVPEVGMMTWYAQDMAAWDTNGQTMTLDTGAPGSASEGPLFLPQPEGLNLRFESANPVVEDATLLSANGVGTAQFWVAAVGGATDVTVEMTVLLVGPGGSRVLGSGSVTKHVLSPVGTVSTVPTAPFVIEFVPAVTDVQPDERLLLDVLVHDAGQVSSSRITSFGGGADEPILVTLPVDVTTAPTSPSVDLSIGGLQLNAPVTGGAWSVPLDTRSLTNGAYTLSATPKAVYGGVLRTGAAVTRGVTITNVGLNTPPTASVSLNALSGPVPLSVTANIGGSDAQTPASALAWEIAWGDGATSAGTGVGGSATHVYTAAGAYTVSLKVTDAGGLFDTASAGPVAAFEVVEPVDKVIVLVDGADAIDATDDTGDGSFAEWSASLSLLDAGVHTITARHVRDAQTLSEASVSITIHVPDVPVIEILSHADGATVSPGDALTGSVEAQGTITSVTATHGATSVDATTNDGFATWSVDLDALGLVEDAENEIVLTATTAEGSDTDSVTLTLDGAPNPRIDVVQSLPVLTQTDVDFVASGTPAATGSPIASWTWNFGDGASSTDTNPTHSYARSGDYEVTLAVTDENGAIGTATRVVTILNRAPSVALAADPSTPTTLDDVTFSVTSSDAESGIVAESVTIYDGLTADDDVLATGGSGLTFRFPDDGTFLVVASAEDEDGAVSKDEVLLVVSNVRPVAALLGSPTLVSTDADVDFDASGSSDPDGTIVEYVFDLADGTTVTQATPLLTHQYSTSGTFAVTVTVVDDDGSAITSDPVSITVNMRPVLGAIGNKIVDEGHALAFTVTATDAENDALAFTLGPLPAGASFDDGTGEFSWTPDFTQTGNYILTAAVTDGLGSDEEQFYISVGNVNRPPVLDPVGDIFGAENAPIVVQLTASDPDLTPLTFNATGLPSGASLNATTGLLTWTPTYTQKGDYPVTLRVTDGDIVDSESVIIHVANVDRAPVLNPITSASILQLSTLRIPLTATDADGDALDFAVDGPAGMTVVNTGGGHGEVRFTPTLAQLGPYTFTVYVTDGELTASQTAVATVIFKTDLTVNHASASFVQASPGQVVTMKAELKNTGPQTDTFEISATNTAGWTLGSLPAPITLASGASQIVALDVIVPNDRPVSFTSIFAKSLGDGTTTRNARFKVEVPVVIEQVTLAPITNLNHLPKGTVHVTHLDGTPAVGAQVTVTQMHKQVGGPSRTTTSGVANDTGEFSYDFTTQPGAMLPGEHQLVVTSNKVGGPVTTVVRSYSIGVPE